MKRQTIRDLSKKEAYVLVFSLLLVATPYALTIYYTIIASQTYTTSFQVFYVETQERDETQTMVLTYGVGKFYFIGNWTNQLLVDHNYTVTYVHKFGNSKHAFNDLIITNYYES